VGWPVGFETILSGDRGGRGGGEEWVSIILHRKVFEVYEYHILIAIGYKYL